MNQEGSFTIVAVTLYVCSYLTVDHLVLTFIF